MHAADVAKLLQREGRVRSGYWGRGGFRLAGNAKGGDDAQEE